MNRRKFISGFVASSSFLLAGCSRTDTVSDMPRVYMGNPDAPITIVSHEDYSCPHCRDFALNQFPEEVKPYVENGDVLYVRRDFPVVNSISWRSGQFARAVQYHYDEYRESDFSMVPTDYWTAHDMLYENQQAVISSPSSEYNSILSQLTGGDADTTLSDTSNGKFRPVVENDRAAGNDIGVSQTPTILLNGNKVRRESGNIEESIKERL